MNLFPDPVLALLLWVPFAVTLAVLKFVLIDPVRVWLDGREHAISGEKKRADALRHEAEEGIKQIEARLAAAREAAGKVRLAHVARGQEAEAAAVATARQAAEGALSAAVREIAQETATARENVAGVAAQLSTEIAGRALGRAVSA